MISALAGLAGLAVTPLERSLPVWIDASQGTGASLRRGQQWCNLLQLSRRIRWRQPGGRGGNRNGDIPRGEHWQADLSGEHNGQLWRCAATALVRHRRLQAGLNHLGSREAVAIALPPGNAGRFEQRLGCWAGVTAYGDANGPIRIQPFSNRRIFDLMLSLPAEMHRQEAIPQALIRAAWPELLAFPVNGRAVAQHSA